MKQSGDDKGARNCVLWDGVMKGAQKQTMTVNPALIPPTTPLQELESVF